MRRTIFVITILLLTVLFVGFRLHSGRHVSDVTANVQTESYADPVERYKSVREALRSAEKAQLNDIAHGSADEELARMAQEQLILLCLRDEQESTCEAILEMRGFEAPVVTVHGESVNVILRAETLTSQQNAVIMEQVCRETGLCADNIKIIPIKS